MSLIVFAWQWFLLHREYKRKLEVIHATRWYYCKYGTVSERRIEVHNWYHAAYDRLYLKFWSV